MNRLYFHDRYTKQRSLNRSSALTPIDSTIKARDSAFTLSLPLISAVCFLGVIVGCRPPPDDLVLPTTWTLTSPDGDLQIDLRLVDTTATDATSLQYRLQREGRALLDWSPLGLETSAGDFQSGLQVSATPVTVISESYEAVHGKSVQREHAANELRLIAHNEARAPIEVQIRAANDGVAYRYTVGDTGELTVLSEASGFAISGGEKAWMTPYDIGGALFGGAYEQAPEAVTIGDATDASGWAYPALFEVSESDWLLITEAELTESYCGTRLYEKPNGNLYTVRFPRSGEGMGVGSEYPTGQAPLTTPWRVIIAGELATLVESTLVDDLSSPSTIADPSWIQPGIAAWSWFSQYTGNAALQHEYIDFAAEMGWDYVLIDEGWDRWDQAETVVPELITRANNLGVGIFLWYNSGGEHNLNPGTPRERMLDSTARAAEMAKLKNWGTSGIKVDFFESDKQDRIQQYLAIAADAAAHELMVNFHGATLPRGWSRTYPNVLTHEAVRGAEYYETPLEGPRPIDNVRFGFTRNVVGPMDYTPLTFAAAYDEVGTTYAHQLALSVIIESGIQHFADRADSSPDKGFRKLFTDYPFTQDFLTRIPANWDDTLFLKGHPDSHIVIARKSGDTWYVAGINGTSSELPITIQPDFLTDDTLRIETITDGDSPDSLDFESNQQTASEPISLLLPARGGFLITYLPL